MDPAVYPFALQAEATSFDTAALLQWLQAAKCPTRLRLRPRWLRHSGCSRLLRMWDTSVLSRSSASLSTRTSSRGCQECLCAECPRWRVRSIETSYCSRQSQIHTTTAKCHPKLRRIVVKWLWCPGSLWTSSVINSQTSSDLRSDDRYSDYLPCCNKCVGSKVCEHTLGQTLDVHVESVHAPRYKMP